MADNEKINEWTVMFFFAGDNALSPLIVSQLKAIKDAGFHEDVDVVAHFDSNVAGIPSRIFYVNSGRKRQQRFMIGDNGNLVSDMKGDNIGPNELVGDGEHTVAVKASMEKPDSVTSLDALKNFIGFCAEKHKAKNYILFLVGHGLVVGHDAFLPDDNPVSAISLSNMRETLEKFNEQIEDHKGTLQLLALHSCSMSAVEVAYELQGLAKYMMGSEGISYIGSWPYRQLLMKIISTVATANGDINEDTYGEGDIPVEEEVADEKPDAVQKLIERLYFLSLSNATDFALSGYSLDLCLCSLDTDNFKKLAESIRLLVRRMVSALDDSALEEKAIEEKAPENPSPKGRIIRELILLAHWESQSYWEENYTDLFDFCQCLHKRCTLLINMLDEFTDPAKTQAMHDDLYVLAEACSGVMGQLTENKTKGSAERFKRLIIRSKHSGPQYQYSHGLSVYFPWSMPVDDAPPPIVLAPQKVEKPEEEKVKCEKHVQGEVTAAQVMKRYHDYKFNADMEGESWADFLDAYFMLTMRKTRNKEDGVIPKQNGMLPGLDSFNHFGPMAGNVAALTGDKSSPSTGRGCTCTSIKNYPSEEIIVAGKTRRVKTS
jgi:hypothetical protein